jgi:hypothetical protein
VGVATPDLRRLAARVLERRLQLNLSIKRAADLADLSKDTWMRVESGDNVRHMTYDKIETALGWTVGSCRKIMDGGEAVLLDETDPGVTLTPVPTEDLEKEIRGAVQGALIATTDDLTAAQIREVNNRAIQVLRDRGILPPGE